MYIILIQYCSTTTSHTHDIPCMAPCSISYAKCQNLPWKLIFTLDVACKFTRDGKSHNMQRANYMCCITHVDHSTNHTKMHLHNYCIATLYYHV